MKNQLIEDELAHLSGSPEFLRLAVQMEIERKTKRLKKYE